MDPMTMSAITQVGGSLLNGLFGKKNSNPKPPMAKGDPSFGVLQSNQNPLQGNQNYMTGTNSVPQQPPTQNGSSWLSTAPWNQANGNTIMNNLKPPQTGDWSGPPIPDPANNARMNINGNNPQSMGVDVKEGNPLEQNIPALLGSGAGALYDIFNNKKPEYKREVDPYTKQMVSQSANATSQANAYGNQTAGAVMAGASGSADKAMTASLGNAMATGGGVDNASLGASKSAIESSQMNTAYSGGIAQGGSIATQGAMNHAQTLGNAANQTMYKESMPNDSAGLMALQGISALPKIIADGQTAENQQNWRKGYEHNAQSKDSLTQTGNAMANKKNGIYNPMDMNNFFSSLFQKR
jgi:hypothetical protein